MLKGDEYIGRRSSQRGLGRSPLCNTYKVSVYGRKLAIQNFAEAIRTDQHLRAHLPRLSGKRVVCHCLPTQECPADSIFAEYKLLHPEAYDREATKGAVPSSAVLSRLAQLRVEPDSDGGSTPDEGAPKRGPGWTGRGGRWAVDDRRYPEDSIWSEVAKCCMTYSEKAGTPELLTSLALGKISSCPFTPEEIGRLSLPALKCTRLSREKSWPTRFQADARNRRQGC